MISDKERRRGKRNQRWKHSERGRKEKIERKLEGGGRKSTVKRYQKSPPHLSTDINNDDAPSLRLF